MSAGFWPQHAQLQEQQIACIATTSRPSECTIGPQNTSASCEDCALPFCALSAQLDIKHCWPLLLASLPRSGIIQWVAVMPLSAAAQATAASAVAAPRGVARRCPYAHPSSLSLAATRHQQTATQRQRQGRLLLCAAAGEGSEAAEPEGQAAAPQGSAVAGPRDDDVLPDSLTGALEDASQATVEALERGVDRCVVRGAWKLRGQRSAAGQQPPSPRFSADGPAPAAEPAVCRPWACLVQPCTRAASHRSHPACTPCPAAHDACRFRARPPPPLPPLLSPRFVRRWRCCCPSCGTR